MRQRSTLKMLTLASAWMLVGGIITVLVTWTTLWLPWGWDLRETSRQGEYMSTKSERIPWPAHRRPGWPETASHREQLTCFWADEDRFRDLVPTNSGMAEVQMFDRRTGFPFRSLGWLYVSDSLGAAGLSEHGFWGKNVQPPGLKRRVLPFLPLWPGFALNTLLYATLAFALSRLPLALRRHHRRRTNRCPTCGYARAGLPPQSPCPECGTHSPPM